MSFRWLGLGVAVAAQAAPLASWDEAFASQTGLAKRHNTLAFLAEAALRKVP